MRKASLSLSVNAIVVLVLALTMLGVGISFTKNMLGGLADKVVVPEPETKATRSEPIQLPYETINAEVDKSLEFSVSVYNTVASGTVSYTSFCKERTSSGWTASSVGSPLALSQEISQGKSGKFKFSMNSPPSSKKYICTLTFCVLKDDTNYDPLDDGSDCNSTNSKNINGTIASKQYVIKFE